MDYIEEKSGGQLHIDPFWAGSLLSTDQNLIELRHGVADVGAIQPIYARGGAHALRTQAGFYAGAVSFEQQTTVFKCLSRHYPALGAELKGLRVLAVQGGSLPGVVTRSTPVRTIAHLQGLRLRAPSELTEMLRSLGVDPVNMPMSEVYGAMAKGVIDGVIAPLDALRSLHLADVGHHYAELAIPRGAYPSRAIRTRTFESLPRPLQQLLDASSEIWETALAREVQRARETGRAYAHERGMQFTELSVTDQQAFDRAYDAAARSYARMLTARGVDGDGMFRDARAWIAKLRARGSEPQPVDTLCPEG
jgi:TRAP-type C4-dicarboxylate transport system substrate-binding protein